MYAPMVSGEMPFSEESLIAATHRVRETAYLIQSPQTGALGVSFGGEVNAAGSVPLVAMLPPLYPEWLGDRSFQEVHGVRFPYVSGAMANGIATTQIVIEMARAGFLGFFGAAGLSPQRVSQALDQLESTLGDQYSWGINLIHSPSEPAIEEAVSDMYIRRGVKRVSAAAYMNLTPYIVRYAYTGVRQSPDGRIHRSNYVFAKISRPEVARRFMEPAPKEMLEQLVAAGKLTTEEARLAQRLPVAEDFIVESDSGGHTDNQALGSLFPIISSLGAQTASSFQYERPLRIGAAGGIGTPSAAAAAFSLGAAFVLTGSINQACVESGLHQAGKEMLVQASIADVMMAAAADMFELGVEVQVLKRGTMFATRANKLRELYKAYPSLESLPAQERARLEREYFKGSLEQAWQETEAYWQRRDPHENQKAAKDPKHKMALLFRAYLGQSSRWAIDGLPDRRMDYQIWCGPAMGAFNAWTAGTPMAEPSQRRVAEVARNMMEGAAVVTRAQQFRSYGVAVPPAAFDYRPRQLV